MILNNVGNDVSKVFFVENVDFMLIFYDWNYSRGYHNGEILSRKETGLCLLKD